MHKTGCSGDTILVLQYLAHHKLESLFKNLVLIKHQTPAVHHTSTLA